VHRSWRKQLHLVELRQSGHRRRERSWWRSRRLIAAVVCVDLLGAGSLAYAITRPGDRPAATSASSQPARQTLGSAARPATVNATSKLARARRPRLAPATNMPSQTMSRAPAALADAKVRSAVAPALRADARPSFAALSEKLAPQARIAIAVQPVDGGRMQVLGDDPPMQAMSTSKILILSAVLRDRGGVDNLTPEQRSLAQAAITQSDNDSILSLFTDLEADKGGLVGASAYATSLLRSAGDEETQVTTATPPAGYATTFGQTPWTPSAEVSFFRALALGCVLAPADTDYELGLMRAIEPSESWGLGSAGFDRVAFKGGWGPEPSGQYGVRQTGIIGSGNSAVVVSVAADPAATFGAGQSALDQVGQWLHREIQLTPRPAGACRE
jgi:hypothetical protein